MEIETKLKSIVAADGSTLYEHLLNTIGKLVQDHPKNAYEAFEEYSDFVKTTKYKYYDTANFRDSSKLRDSWDELAPYITKMREYFGYVEKKGEEEEDNQDSNPIGYVPDMMNEEKLFRKIGLGFGEIETFMIFSSLKKFVATKSASQAKFWGKINGTKRDYYIVEAVVEGGEEVEITEPHEAKGTGVNAKQYFVSNDSLHSVKTEDDGGDPNLQEIQEVEFEEEQKPLSGQALADLNNWVHYNASILKEGRLIHAEIEDEELDDEAKELLKKQKEFNDPFEPRLKPLSQDKYLDLPTCWIMKTHGSFTTTRHQYKNELVHDTLISLRSLVWPGLYYICKDQFVSSIYIGDGHKYTNKLYFPQFPYLIQSEPDSRSEQIEPNPPGCENENNNTGDIDEKSNPDDQTLNLRTHQDTDGSLDLSFGITLNARANQVKNTNKDQTINDQRDQELFQGQLVE